MNGYLTTSQAAGRLGITRWRVNALIRDGRLTATRMGQIFVIDERDLKAVKNRRPGHQAKAKPEQSDDKKRGKGR